MEEIQESQLEMINEQEIQFSVTSDQKMKEFQSFLDDINVDFKENISKKVYTIKLQDTNVLNLRIEQLKMDEKTQIEQFNVVFQQLQEKSQQIQSKRIFYKKVIKKLGEWKFQKKLKVLFNYWKKYSDRKIQQRKKENYIINYYKHGLMRKAFKNYQLFIQVAGNKMYEEKVKEQQNFEVQNELDEKKNEIQFLDAQLKELEELLKIEIRKKAILKNQCDKAYLKGVSDISIEALKMSHSTLHDFYSGMKMSVYDGNNIIEQIKRMNEPAISKKQQVVTDMKYEKI